MSKKVLFIDDDQVLQTLIVQLLATHLNGYAVLAASNSKEGLAMARSEKPDIVVLDIVLGDENGWDVAEALKRDPGTRSIPIVIASGAGNPFKDDQLAVKIVRKPYDVDELAAAILEVAGPA